MKSYALSTIALAVFAHAAHAQLPLAKDNPIVYGHHHVTTSDVDAHKRFWGETLGGVPVTRKAVPVTIYRFPNVLVFIADRGSSGGTTGTTVDHISFGVSDLRAVVQKLKAAGYPIITRTQAPQGSRIRGDVAFVRDLRANVAFTMAPDDTKVELVESESIEPAPTLHHIHFAASDPQKMRAWYVDTFGAAPIERSAEVAAALPGLRLTFSKARDPIAPTRGRALDHIGFEVQNLESFCRKLEASGVKLDRAYTQVPALGIAIAFLTDPWGTYIELTEGLASVE